MNKILMCYIILWPLALFAQPGISEMGQARDDLSTSFFSAFDLSLVVAAILGTVGAVRIYHNWQMGQKEITAEVAAWFFAALFMVLSGVFLRALFVI